MHAIPKISRWHPVRHPPALSADGLHLWRIRTGPEGGALAQLWLLLAPRELDRARKLKFDHHRERYVRAQAGLRRILSGYVGIDPRAIGYQFSRTGKPNLQGIASGLEFNLTTSGDLALVAVSEPEPVGVDCEQVCSRTNILAIAKRMFAPETSARIIAAAPGDRLEQFHIAWTALEAEVKADGRGLLGRNKSAARDGLRIEHCVPEPGFVAAVARNGLTPVSDWDTLELTAD